MTRRRFKRGDTQPIGSASSDAVATARRGGVSGPAPAAVLERALHFRRTGNPAKAEALYRQVLAADPEHFDALHHLGLLKAQSGQYDEARGLIAAALTLRPRSAEASLNLGYILEAMGRTEQALATYDRALAAKPGHAEALYSRGNALQALGRYDEALASYDAALAVLPEWAEALGNRANTLHDLERYEEALASCDKAIALMPGSALLHNNRGNTLRELGRFEEALASLDRALTIEAGRVDALNNRGNTLLDLQRYEEGLRCFDEALARAPGNAAVHNNRGNALQELMRYEEAVQAYERALAIKPDFADALVGRGDALHALKRYEEAVASYEKALALSPNFEYVAGMLANSRMYCCDWRHRREDVDCLVQDVRAGKRSVYPFAFVGLSESPQDQLQCARIVARDKCNAVPAPPWTGQPYRHDRIRVAYLSADFREHVMAYCLAELFERHDRARFDTTAISLGPDAPSRMRSRLMGAFDRFIDVRRRSDREVATLLRELEIDIAVDLMGYTMGSRIGIFASRGAPIQVNYLGYPGTLGADCMDYILADRVVIPEQHLPYYAEKVVYLPDSYQANDSRRVMADRTPSRAEAGLPEQGFVFCSFNNSYKIGPAVFGAWMLLLGKVEGSVLWLADSGSTAVRNLRTEAAERGIAPARLVFAPKIGHADYLARHRLADLALDTLPYNGHGTTSDALWSGLPVLTCLGTSFAGRVAASLLNAVGLGELITHSLVEYEALALQLAMNPERLADIRSKLARNRDTCPLFDTGRFCRHIEAAYTTMWERCQRGEPPASFAVEPLPGNRSGDMTVYQERGARE